MSALCHFRTHALQQRRLYSITSVARKRMAVGTVRPSVFAVLRLTTRENLVGACTGRLAGFLPRRMRSTYDAEARNERSPVRLLCARSRNRSEIGMRSALPRMRTHRPRRDAKKFGIGCGRRPPAPHLAITLDEIIHKCLMVVEPPFASAVVPRRWARGLCVRTRR
jgi:hypothetical protein